MKKNYFKNAFKYRKTFFLFHREENWMKIKKVFK